MSNTWLKPTWKKVLAELWGNKVRSFLVILSIAVGTFAVGLVSSAYIILSSDVNLDFQSQNPHGAVIYTESFDDDLLESVRKIPGIESAEGRGHLMLRLIVTPEKKTPIILTALPPLDDMELDLIRSESGSLPSLNDHEIFIERSSLMGAPLEIGDFITIEMSGNRTRTLKVSAIVHDVTVAPYMFTGQLNGYVSQDTMVWLGGERNYNQMLITVSDQKTDEAHLNVMAQTVEDKIEKSGRKVSKFVIPTPGEHYASDFIAAMGFMMGGLGTLAVLLSVFLAVNIITALLAAQVRQIGIMKLVGGQPHHLIRIYLSLVLCFGFLSLFIALPLSAFVSYKLSELLAGFLNFDLQPFRIPWVSVALQVFVALVIPVLAALIPIRRGTHLTIRAAISDYGVSLKESKGYWVDQLIEKIRGLPRPLLLSLRNVFRKKMRLILTLSTLILGGAIFISVFSVRTSLQVSIKEALGYFLSDVNITLPHPRRFQELEAILSSVPGVEDIEGWMSNSAQVYFPDHVRTNEVTISAPPADSSLIQPVIASGRWLTPEDQNALVISNHLVAKREDLEVGDWVELKIGGENYPFQIVGICTIAGNLPTPIVYATREYMEIITNNKDMVSEFRIATTMHSATYQKQTAQLLEAQLKRKGYRISSISTGAENSGRFVVVINMMVSMLLVMAVLIALVGGLGLSGMMSQNVLERTREIGVMRAIGAADKSVLTIVVAEGVVIGMISWFVGIILSIPISLILEDGMGRGSVGAPFPSVMISFEGPVIWLIGVLLLSTISCILPAYRASKLTIREVLAYD